MENQTARMNRQRAKIGDYARMNEIETNGSDKGCPTGSDIARPTRVRGTARNKRTRRTVKLSRDLHAELRSETRVRGLLMHYAVDIAVRAYLDGLHRGEA
jgi:hypothetical protein